MFQMIKNVYLLFEAESITQVVGILVTYMKPLAVRIHFESCWHRFSSEAQKSSLSSHSSPAHTHTHYEKSERVGGVWIIKVVFTVRKHKSHPIKPVGVCLRVQCSLWLIILQRGRWQNTNTLNNNNTIHLYWQWTSKENINVCVCISYFSKHRGHTSQKQQRKETDNGRMKWKRVN